jgi:hypothetical protein
MIYCGYQGVGKSTYCRNNPNTTVDLDSSNFKKVDDWYVDYVKTALDLSKSGKNVFISAHREVISYLIYHKYDFELIIPADDKELWAKRLEFRYMKNKTVPNLKAIHDFNINFEEDMHFYYDKSKKYNIKVHKVTSKIVTNIGDFILDN